MAALIVIGIVITAVVCFDLLAYWRGADSRPGFPRTSDTILD
jgi:hypothetical protein